MIEVLLSCQILDVYFEVLNFLLHQLGLLIFMVDGLGVAALDTLLELPDILLLPSFLPLSSFFHHLCHFISIFFSGPSNTSIGLFEHAEVLLAHHLVMGSSDNPWWFMGGHHARIFIVIHNWILYIN